MDNFDLRKYLAEGRLLKEEINSELEDYIVGLFDQSVEEEEGLQDGVWEKEEYASDDYEDAEVFLELIDYLKSTGGKYTLEGDPDINLELLPNGDIKWSANVVFESLKENNSGLYITYDEDITDIRGSKGETRRIGFSKPVNFENSAMNDAIYKHISNIYGPGEMDWRDDQELEYTIS
jgi:hypothetical protein